jgi:CheY-like chemotaxis protein
MSLSSESNSEAQVSAPVTFDQDRRADSVILVVDDAPVDARIAMGILEKRPETRVLVARNGQVALSLIEQNRPDLVVTDLQMPHMDGFQLVEAIRERFPYLPTVLMTAHGSEEIAMRALQRGAASYVRKEDLARRLNDTVDEVLALSAGKRQQQRLWPAWNHTEFSFSLENNPSLIHTLVAHLRLYMGSLAYHNEMTFIRMGVALHEALSNAMYHGNLELDSSLRGDSSGEYYRRAEQRRTQQPYASRRVHVTLRENAQESRYVVRDEGSGFDVKATRSDPTDPANLQRPSGRGLFLIQTFMDEVTFNESGNEITMVHYRPLRAE